MRNCHIGLKYTKFIRKWSGSGRGGLGRVLGSISPLLKRDFFWLPSITPCIYDKKNVSL